MDHLWEFMIKGRKKRDWKRGVECKEVCKKQNATKQTVRKQNAPKHNAPKHNAPKHNAPKPSTHSHDQMVTADA